MFINRNFALLWVGQAISILGDTIYGSALILWVASILGKGESWAPLAVSGTLLAQYLPAILFGPLAGVFVDRWPARTVMLWMDGLRALLVALLLLVVGLALVEPGISVSWQLGIVYGVTLLVETCSQFFNPARLSLIGDIVEPEQQARATGLSQMTIGIGTVVGPALAALLVFGVGMQWALLLEALSFVVSFFTLLLIRLTGLQLARKERQHRRVLAEFSQGLRVLSKSRVLLSVLLAYALMMLAIGAVNELALFFVTDVLRAPASLFGIMATVLGLGAIGGALLAGMVARPLGLPRLLWGASICMGLSIVLLVSLVGIVPAFILVCLMGCFMSGINVASEPLILQYTPRAFVGRVNAVQLTLGSLASVLSVALFGLLNSSVPPTFALSLFAWHLNITQLSLGSAGLLLLGGGVLICLLLRKKAALDAVAVQEEMAADPVGVFRDI